MSQNELLSKAKQKLQEMNKKVHNAAKISDKHRLNKAGNDTPKVQTKQKFNKADYLFELTEKMVADGFDADEVTKYIEKLEKLSEKSEQHLENNEITVTKEIKKINKSLRQFLNPADKSSEASSVISSEENNKSSIDNKTPHKEEQNLHKQDEGPSYSELARRKSTPTPKKTPEQRESKIPHYTPTKIPKHKEKQPVQPEPNDDVQMTGAGAQFLASLACDEEDDNNNM